MHALVSLLSCLPFLVCSLLSRTLFALGDHTIYGTVRQADGTLAKGATVDLSGQSGLNMRTFTDGQGRYEFAGVAGDHYWLVAANPADSKQTMDPVEVDTSAFMAARIMVNLYLRNTSQSVSPKGPASGVVSLGEVQEQVPKSAQKAFNRAIELRDRGMPDEALKSFTKAIQIFPDYFRALTERGHLYITRQRPNDARNDFARALELNPRYGPALRGAGMCEFQEGKFAEAVETLTKATDAEPRNATNYLFIGISEVALDRRAQARSALLKALGIDAAGSVRAHVHLASLYIKDGQTKEAAREIEIYLAAAPDAPDADHFREILDRLRNQNAKR